MQTDYRNVKLTGGFWKIKEDLNRDVTIPAVYERFYDTGRIDAFKCDWKEGMPNKPHYFWDSDVAKWMEGAANCLFREEIPELSAKVEELIDRIEANQGEDGYFNIYFTVVAPDKRFKDRNCHELYCAGHLMEAACAYYHATGKDRFLKIMEKYVDHIAQVFMKDKSAAFLTPGHEEIELALFKMYRTTGKEKYKDLAEYFLETRGQSVTQEKQIFDVACHTQSHAPVRMQHEAFGHSVRAVYLYSAMADLAMETGDTELLDACRDLFNDMTKRKMYVTGGIGSTDLGEGFTVPFDLPNDRAYVETCASIGMIFFANRMLKADPLHAAAYADTIELEMYNGALSGLSMDGEKFFYENPLEIYMKDRKRITGTNDEERWPITERVRVFSCSCCPPNLNRLLSSLGEYFYAFDEKTKAVWVNQFGESTFEKDGVRVSQKTAYPFDGKIEIEAGTEVHVRIPGWCRHFTADQPYRTENGYAVFMPGVIRIEFEMKPELIASRTLVVRNIGKAALRFGPMIYCAEGIDHPYDLHTFYFDRTRMKNAEVTEDPAFDAPVILLDAYHRIDKTDELYAPLSEHFEPAKLKMIPYHAFANRGETDMLVFLNYR